MNKEHTIRIVKEGEHRHTLVVDDTPYGSYGTPADAWRVAKLVMDDILEEERKILYAGGLA